MLSVFYATLSPMLVMLITVLTGFFLTKKRIISKEATLILSALETYVFVPCLIVKTFLKYCTFESLKSNFSLIAYCLAVLFLSFWISFFLCPLFSKEKYEKNIYRYSLIFSNFSFLGNSVIPSVLGEEALYFYMLYTLPLMIFAYSWGVYILIPRENKKRSPLFNLINPVFVSILLGIFLGLSGAKAIIPSFITQSVESFASCMSPVAMLLTGCVIGKYDISELLKNKKVYIICFLKLIVLPLLFVFVSYLLGADKNTQILTFFAFGTALGLNTIIFPSAYGKDAKTGASMAMLAQAFSVLTIPLIYALLS